MQNRRNGRNVNDSGIGGGRFQSRDNDRQPSRDRNDRGNSGAGRERGRDIRNHDDRDKGDNRGSNARNDPNIERDGGQKDRKFDNYRDKNIESNPQNDTSQNISAITTTDDTEEDWDKELSEHNVEQSNFNDDQNNENWDSGDGDDNLPNEQNKFDNDDNNERLQFKNDVEMNDEKASDNTGMSTANEEPHNETPSMLGENLGENSSTANENLN